MVHSTGDNAVTVEEVFDESNDLKWAFFVSEGDGLSK